MKREQLYELLTHASGKNLLFLGREATYTKKEIERFLKKYGIGHSKVLDNDTAAVVEAIRLNPVEEDISNDAYERKLPVFTLAVFEQHLSENLNSDEILMGIKLSNDQERVFRLLQSIDIDETLFLKLLEMYEWHEEEDDNTKDRDVIMSVLRRYIQIKPNEEDLLYSYLTLRRLATEATNPLLLSVLTGFPNYSFLVRGKEKITLRETIARNEHINKEVIVKLTGFRDAKIDAALAGNRALTSEQLRSLAQKESGAIYQALATNVNIDDLLFEQLLHKSEKTVQLLLFAQPITLKRFETIEAMGFQSEVFAVLGANEKLERKVVEKLLQSDNVEVLKNLSANEALESEVLRALYEKGMVEIYSHLAMNAKTPVEILTRIYDMGKDDLPILASLAFNNSTPEEVLRELFQKDEFEINKALATNASVPMELLDILKIDTRLQNQLAQNDVFVKEYETVLNYDGKAIT